MALARSCTSWGSPRCGRYDKRHTSVWHLQPASEHLLWLRFGGLVGILIDIVGENFVCEDFLCFDGLTVLIHLLLDEPGCGPIDILRHHLHKD